MEINEYDKPRVNKICAVSKYWLEPSDTINTISLGNIEYKIREIAAIIETKINDFFNNFDVLFPFSNSSADKGNIVFPIDELTKIITLPIKETNANCPAISGEKNLLANIMSMLYIRTIEIVAIISGKFVL